ncbi:discoidin domain-containing protein [Lysinibacillus pakistanensis]|uniref:discoidin domain-containing protein n=1 Tax=Lysinibacillus pakistanensis TaxID=759811 RepID=UPI003D2CC8E5
MTGYILLQANSKRYSLDYKDIWYETKMTSDTTPYPLVASASTIYSTAYPAWRAFDGTKDVNGWSTANNNITNQWLRIDFGAKTRVNKSTVVARAQASASIESPKNFDFQGSNDGEIWITLKEVRDQTGWKASEQRTYEFDKEGNFKYYQIFVHDFNGDTSPVISELIYGYQGLSIYELVPGPNQDFIDYGKAEFSNLNKAIVQSKYVLKDTNSGNQLLSAQIKRKPKSVELI